MNLNDRAKLLLRRQIWGPFLIAVGSYILFVSRHTGGLVDLMDKIQAGVAVALILAGIVMMFYQLRSDEGVAITIGQAEDQSSSQPEYTVAQLSKNY